MHDSLTQTAIDAAISNNWDKALATNLAILKETPDDIDSLNRLGKAYLELGNTKKAIETLKKVLKLNKYDAIANKNLLRAQSSPVKPPKNTHGAQTRPPTEAASFLEEPGKTKVIALVNLAPAKTLLTTRCADFVNLVVKRHSILVETTGGIYLGALPDDLGHRLLVLIKGGNAYTAFIKGITKGTFIIFIKEKTRAKKFKNTPSFPTGSTDYLSFVREDGQSDADDHKAPEDGSDDDDEAVFKKTQSLHDDELPEEN